MTPLPGNVQGHEIGSKQFGMQDQQIFASLSCDRNPMHVDPVAARRLLTGQPVVHGIHVLMTALEYWENGSAQPPAFLDCTFNNPVSVGDIVVFRQIRYENGDTVIEAGVNGLLCARLRLTAARAPSVASNGDSCAAALGESATASASKTGDSIMSTDFNVNESTISI